MVHATMTYVMKQNAKNLILFLEIDENLLFIMMIFQTTGARRTPENRKCGHGYGVCSTIP